MYEDRSQLYYFDAKKGIKTVKTRIGDGLYTKLVTYNDGKRKLNIYNYDALIYTTTIQESLCI